MAALDAQATAVGDATGEPTLPSVASLSADVASPAKTSATAPSTESSPTVPAAVELDPAVAALCTPITDDAPCGPDLDLANDAAYLNFMAQVEGVLPTVFFDPLEGTPFDPTKVDIASQLKEIKGLIARSRDIRLLVLQSRLHILDRNLAGFAVSLAAAAYWLDVFWDQVLPRPEGGGLDARSTAIAALDKPTVTLPVQYAPLFEARRLGVISYRRLMIANDEVKPRNGEEKLVASAITEALGEADPGKLAGVRRHVAMLKSALDQIRNAFAKHGTSADLDSVPALVAKIQAFIDPVAAAAAESATYGDDGDIQAGQDAETAAKASGPRPTSLAQASEALAAVADYYSRLEPSSPTLPLVRQAHQLIGKSFIEIMSILAPTQMENVAFQIGSERFFDLPLSRLSNLSAADLPAGPSEPAASDGGNSLVGYSVNSRSQAVALLDQVQRFFRAAEPSSPVPMLCERARALAERDFMGVLREVLPSAALKNAGTER